MIELTPQQIKDREAFKRAIPDEDDRMALMISIAKHASHLCEFVEKNAHFIEPDAETLYRMALLMNFIFNIWGFQEGRHTVERFPYSAILKEDTIDERFGKVIKYLYEEAKKRKLV